MYTRGVNLIHAAGSSAAPVVRLAAAPSASFITRFGRVVICARKQRLILFAVRAIIGEDTSRNQSSLQESGEDLVPEEDLGQRFFRFRESWQHGHHQLRAAGDRRLSQTSAAAALRAGDTFSRRRHKHSVSTRCVGRTPIFTEEILPPWQLHCLAPASASRSAS